jgi:hypothetical protein
MAEVEDYAQGRRYKQNAKQCRALAALVTRPEDKVTLEEIAKAWEKVAAFRAHDLYEADE